MSRFRLVVVDTSIKDLARRAREATEAIGDHTPILVMDEDGEFRIDWNGERGEKIIVHGLWADIFLSGEFALVRIPR